MSQTNITRASRGSHQKRKFADFDLFCLRSALRPQSEKKTHRVNRIYSEKFVYNLQNQPKRNTFLFWINYLIENSMHF